MYHDLSCKANVKMVTFIMIYHDTSQYITICNNTSERGILAILHYASGHSPPSHSKHLLWVIIDNEPLVRGLFML